MKKKLEKLVNGLNRLLMLKRLDKEMTLRVVVMKVMNLRRHLKKDLRDRRLKK
jgi:hypothetical protein